MSRPREATSVATSTPRLPLADAAVRSRNLASASSRTHWSLPLWIARHHSAPWLEPGPNFFCKFHSRSSHVLFWPAKTMPVSPRPSSALSTSTSLSSFASSSSTSTRWITLLFAVSLSPLAPWPIRNCTALALVSDAAVSCTSCGQVAVKKSVCRAEPARGPVAPPASSGFPVAGHFSTMLRMSGSKPMSSILSASSKTKSRTFAKETNPLST
mmetsp:Transcript_79770/g.243914  ORF Transcript_79770/g.243914 Transcript_79770/m.243914 type:complete len:213 (-) Transcript_79770:715-1353(-)